MILPGIILPVGKACDLRSRRSFCTRQSNPELYRSTLSQLSAKSQALVGEVFAFNLRFQKTPVAVKIGKKR